MKCVRDGESQLEGCSEVSVHVCACGVRGEEPEAEDSGPFQAPNLGEAVRDAVGEMCPNPAPAMNLRRDSADALAASREPPSGGIGRQWRPPGRVHKEDPFGQRNASQRNRHVVLDVALAADEAELGESPAQALALPGVFQSAEVAFAGRAARSEVRVEAVVFVVVGVDRGVAGACPPVLLDRLQPAVQLNQVLAADVVAAGAAIVGVGLCVDESCLAESSQVFADEWLALPEQSGELGDGARLVGEFPDDPSPGGLGELVEGGQRRQRFGLVLVAFLHVSEVIQSLVRARPFSTRKRPSDAGLRGSHRYGR